MFCTFNSILLLVIVIYFIYKKSLCLLFIWLLHNPFFLLDLLYFSILLNQLCLMSKRKKEFFNHMYLIMRCFFLEHMKAKRIFIIESEVDLDSNEIII